VTVAAPLSLAVELNRDDADQCGCGGIDEIVEEQDDA
jgi:hypothetical protein